MQEGSSRKFLILLVLLALFSTGSMKASEENRTDSLSLPLISEPEPIPASDECSVPEISRSTPLALDTVPDRNWWHLLKAGKLQLSDTTVQYPKFIGFCVDVYNWADKFFNSYDPDYVVGTGHRWKARLVNDNWTDSYALHFKKNKFNVRMLSDLNVNLGAYLHYMAVSIGYSMNVKTIFTGRKNDHRRFDFNFSCALFSVDLSYYKTDGTHIRQFTGYQKDRYVKVEFPGVEMSDLSLAVYYFLNNKRYSQGAAYNFSKIQKRSAGSWIFGFMYTNLDLDMDFSTLPGDLKPLYLFDANYLKIHYHSYCLSGGYGYNWVWHPKWLFNITVLPAIGFNHCYEDASDGSGNQFALNIHGRTSLTYNHRALFASVIGKISGNWYTSKNLSLFNAIEYFSANVGFRF